LVNQQTIFGEEVRSANEGYRKLLSTRGYLYLPQAVHCIASMDENENMKISDWASSAEGQPLTGRWHSCWTHAALQPCYLLCIPKVSGTTNEIYKVPSEVGTYLRYLHDHILRVKFNSEP
jgi:hypothetical protein